MIDKTLSAVAAVIVYSILLGGLGVGLGLLLGLALRLMWGLLVFFGTGQNLSFALHRDWLEPSARIIGGLHFMYGVARGLYEGWTMEWTMLRPTDAPADVNMDSSPHPYLI